MSDFRKGNIEGLIISKLRNYEDNRGALTEIFRSDNMAGRSLPVMAYYSVTRPGIRRGPHEHREQTVNFFFPAGQEFRMVLWDNRPQSPTFNNKKVIKTGKENLFVSIPPGIVHGYKNTGTKDVFSFNFPDKLFAGQNKKEEIDEIRHEEDPEDAFLKDFDND